VTTQKNDTTTKGGISLPINLDTFTLCVTTPAPDISNGPSNLKCTDVSAYAAAAADTSGAARNRLRAILLRQSNLICSQTQAQIVGANDLVNFGLGESTTLLAGAAAIVTGATAARILSGSAAATNATRSQVNEIFYQNSLKAVIIQKMNDLRSTQLTVIESRSFVNNTDPPSPTPLTAFSVEDMINAIQKYHDQCSFYAGVTGLTQTETTFTPKSLKEIVEALKPSSNSTPNAVAPQPQP
jgi:hypothetical protein